MKKGLKILYSLLFSAVALTSCSESVMDEINTDYDSVGPDAVAAKFSFTNIQNNLACVTVGGDAMFYVMTYTEHEVGTFGQMSEAEMRTSSVWNSTTFNNSWYYLYFHLQELKLIEEKCGEGGTDEGSLFNLGIAQVLRALYLGILTDNWGDVPWTEALRVDEGILQPQLDSQESIYEDIFANLEAGIANLEAGEYGDMPLDDAQDMIYGQYSTVSGTENRAAAYIKFAYSLKARHLMRLSYVNNYSSSDYDAVIAAAEKGFTSATDEAKNSVFNGVSSITPYASFYDSRDYLSLSTSFVKKYTERNDPRYDQYAAGTSVVGTTQYYVGVAANGTTDAQAAYYSITTSCFDGAAPVMYMSYHELMFIKAEAYARKSDLTNAYTALEAAVTAAMVKAGNIATRVYGYTTMTADVIAAYIEDEVKPRFEEDAVQEIAIQKYLGVYQDGETLETYSDMRRQMAMGINYALENPYTWLYPQRLPYGDDDVTANTNVSEAFGDGTYVLSEKVWWAGGTR
ncbi:MAG: SusD/RagB family nutrient-binding outer membrane lipoprotein [Rikenellaceae bacterium]